MKNTMMITMMVFSSIVLLSSCKKAYTCTCDITTDIANVALKADFEPYEGTQTTKGNETDNLDKTNKKTAQANCVSSKQTDVSTESDYADLDGDGNTSEKAYTSTSVSTYDCSLSK